MKKIFVFKCQLCNGTGKHVTIEHTAITASTMNIRCPLCKGTGEIKLEFLRTEKCK